MKSYHFFSLRSVHCMAFAATTLLLSACINGYDEDWTFSSGVTGITLESPKAEEITFTQNPEGTRVTIEWPVVLGAGGYEFIAYNVDDANAPVQLGEAQTIDGCSVDYDIAEDTSYKFCIRSLGNAEAGNQEAATATEITYSTLVPSIATIPEGDIYAYFQSNPIPNQDEEIAYDLVAGGNYTMSGVVDFDTQKITFRGNKVNHPKVTFGENARFVTQAGLKIKFIDFDCNAVPKGSSDASFILLSKTPSEAIKVASGHYVIADPIAIQSCEIRGINRHLIFDNQVKKYCVDNFLVKDCIIGLNQGEVVIYLNKGGGHINNLTFENSTVYSTVQSNKRFIQYGNDRPNKVTGFTNGSLNFRNNTFYNVSYTGEMGNYNGFGGQNTISLNLINNIFVDCGNKQICRRLLGGRAGMVATYRYNTYWYDGAFVTGELSYDNGGLSIQTDPMLADPANSNEMLKDFTPAGSEQLANRTGDPRWLPEVPEGDTAE